MSGANKRRATLKRQASVTPQLLWPVGFLEQPPSQVWILVLLNTKVQLQYQPGHHIASHTPTHIICSCGYEAAGAIEATFHLLVPSRLVGCIQNKSGTLVPPRQPCMCSYIPSSTVCLLPWVGVLRIFV